MARFGSSLCSAPILLLMLTPPAFSAALATDWKAAWPETDFSLYSVALGSIQFGGPPKDGIPSIDQPRFVSVEDAAAWLGEREPVVFVNLEGVKRVYPLQILIWHEIVNDWIGDIPIAVTFCPLCYSSVAFDRRVRGKVLEFGVSGLLRYSNMLMYDRRTHSFWQQGNGKAIVGTMVGTRLGTVPAIIVSFAQVRSGHPDSRVLSRETEVERVYGQNPYAGYDDIDSRPFMYEGQPPERLAPMEHLVTVELNRDLVAYPHRLLRDARVVNDVVGGVPVTVFFNLEPSTVLGVSDVQSARSIGAGAVFERRVEDEVLEFEWNGSNMIDVQTASTWDVFGRGTSGPMKGVELKAVVSGEYFAFSWLTFQPSTRIYGDP